MKRYKLLKDLPTFKAGQLAYISKTGNLIAGTPENQKTTETGLIIMIYHETTLKKFPNILTEWFEEIELTDSIHWKPKNDDWYFYVNDCGVVCSDVWTDHHIDNERLSLGFIYPTEEACERAKERKLAKVRLCKTSDFEPVFESEYGGWIVYFDYENRMLDCAKVFSCDRGELVHYATKEEAEKSIEENREDWLIYFGVEEG